MPVGSGVVSDTPILYDGYEGDYSVLITRQNTLFRGWDFVFGKHINLPCNFFVYGALGGYHLDGFYGSSTWGFQGRGELWWWSFAYAGVYYTHDKIFGSKTEGYVGLSIPIDKICAWLGFCRNNCCDSYCDPGNYTNGWNGRGARVNHLGGGPGTMGSCCRYETNNF